jgi:hypothetical protein
VFRAQLDGPEIAPRGTMIKGKAWQARRVAVWAFASILVPISGRAASSVSLEQLLENQLLTTESLLRDMCEPGCGTVVLDAPVNERIAAQAVPIARDSTLIQYDDRYMQTVREKYGESVTYFVMAHEYGHHLDRLLGSPWTHELRADAVGGCALVRDGLPLEPTLAWMRDEHFAEIVNEVTDDPNRAGAVVARYSNDHPPWIDRIEAARRGAEVCQGRPTLLGFFAQLPSASAREVTARSVLAAGARARSDSSEAHAIASPVWGWGMLLTHPKAARY